MTKRYRKISKKMSLMAVCYLEKVIVELKKSRFIQQLTRLQSSMFFECS